MNLGDRREKQTERQTDREKRRMGRGENIKEKRVVLLAFRRCAVLLSLSLFLTRVLILCFLCFFSFSFCFMYESTNEIQGQHRVHVVHSPSFCHPISPFDQTPIIFPSLYGATKG